MLIGTPLRTVSIEFDAMKTRLAEGVIPAVGGVTSRFPENTYPEPLLRALKRVPLPAAKQSYFHDGDPLHVIALRPFTLREQGYEAVPLADVLSTVHHVPYRMRVRTPIAYAHSGPVGMWDIGSVSVKFDRPVMLHAVTASGDLSALAISSIVAPVGQQPCTGHAMSYTATPANVRWNAAILAWAGKPPSSGAASVASTQTPGRKYDRFTTQVVDVNGDEIADFLLRVGLTPAIVDPGDLVWKAAFANVGGKWVLAGFAQGLDCT